MLKKLIFIFVVLFCTTLVRADIDEFIGVSTVDEYLGVSTIDEAAGQTVATAGGCSPDQSDDFSSDTISDWTQEFGSWSISAGVLNFTRNGLDQAVIRYSNSSLSGLNTYVRVEINDLDYSPGIGLRFGDGTNSDYGYLIRTTATSTFIRECTVSGSFGCDGTLESSATLSWADGDVLCATIQGTGTDTIWKVWKDCIETCPNDADNWDSVSDAADITFTNNPVRSGNGPEEADARYVGLYSYPYSGNTEKFDNFTAGDL